MTMLNAENCLFCRGGGGGQGGDIDRTVVVLLLTYKES